MIPRDLVLAGQRIRALSVGGVETCFELPDVDLCLDIGRCPPGAERRGTLCLTHAHIDHAAGLPYFVSMRALAGMEPPRVYCPKEVEPGLRRVLEAWTDLDADSERCELVGLSPGDELPLPRGYARAFRSPHRVPTLGYTIFRRKTRLRADLVGLSSEAIAARARAGEIVNDTVDIADLAFPGDTRIDVVDREPTVTKARVLLLECTFFGPRVEVSRATRSGHVHFDQILERADRFENEVVLLTHFSRRHSEEEIAAEVAKAPEGLRSRLQLLL